MLPSSFILIPTEPLPTTFPYTTLFRSRALRLEVRKQGEVELAVASERRVAPHAVHRDSEQRRPVALKLGQDLVVKRHLVPAYRAPVGRIERQDHRPAAEIAQRHGLVGGAGEREVGRRRPGVKGSHGCSFQEVRVADSSGTIASSSLSALRSTTTVVGAPIRSVTSS